MNTPNKLSLLRIILVPFILLFMLPIQIFSFAPEGWNQFVLQHGLWIAGIIFIIASLTDLADGKIARKYNLITDLGKFLDSLADKMLVISVLIALVQLGRIAALWVIIIVVREFMVTGIRMVASGSGVIMAAAMIGKIKATTQMVAIIYLLFEPLFMLVVEGLIKKPYSEALSLVSGLGNILFAVAVIMTIISGLDYLFKNLNLFKEAT